MTSTFSPGLDEIVVARTHLSRVDGARGELILAGAALEDLALDEPFEAVLHRLWAAAQVPGLAADPAALTAELSLARQEAWDRLEHWRPALALGDGMSALRAGLVLSCAPGSSPSTLVATAAVVAAAWLRSRRGAAPAGPRPGASHAEDLLSMGLGDQDHLVERARALDTYLCAVVDHGLNASTFTARVITSTGSDDLSAVLGAIGALAGPLHGGAPGPVLDMLDAIGHPEAAEAWLLAELDQGRRIMGMGHRIYRVRDPRAAVLEEATRRLARVGVGGARLALAAEVETTATALLAARHPERPLAANVEFATAVLLEAVGLPREAFATIFATSRCGGWLAHAAEQRRTGRLIRPRSDYVGALPA